MTLSDRLYDGALKNAGPTTGMLTHEKFDQKIFEAETASAGLDIAGVGTHAAALLGQTTETGRSI